jgi:hypothetical protein
MKKSKLSIEKFTISKINNLVAIFGGDGDDGQGETVITKKPTKTKPTTRPTQMPNDTQGG